MDPKVKLTRSSFFSVDDGEEDLGGDEPVVMMVMLIRSFQNIQIMLRQRNALCNGATTLVIANAILQQQMF